MHKLLSALAALAAVSLLAGCTSSSLPDPTPGGSPEAVVHGAQYEVIAQQTIDQFAVADAAKDPAQLGGRIAGPLRENRTAQYQLANAMGEGYSLPPIVLDPQATPIDAGTDFPRTLLAVTPASEYQKLPAVTAWVQTGPRSNYAAWAQITLFPGVKVPALQSGQTNTKNLLDAKKYAYDPAAVANAYAEYNWTRKQGAIPIAESDEFAKQVAQQQDALASAVGEMGTVSTAFAAPEQMLVAAPTKDGGLIVIADVRYTLRIERTNRAIALRIGGEIGALHQGRTAVVNVGKALSGEYSAPVALYVPPAGSEASVQAIGSALPTLLSVTSE
ncbi:MAG: hypothetical protein Q4E03_03175 [Trueperella sp.]|nr:hypothetical protein [Trueperella sp.]